MTITGNRDDSLRSKLMFFSPGIHIYRRKEHVMSRGQAAHQFIKRSVFIAAGTLFAILLTSPVSAQYSYQSIISADLPEQEKAKQVQSESGIEQPVSDTAGTSEFLPPAKIAAAPISAVSRQRKPQPEALDTSQYQTIDDAGDAKFVSEKPKKIDLQSSPIKVAEAKARAEQRKSEQPATPANNKNATSGLLTEQSNSGILPPPDDYQITQDEVALLDQFLTRWEEYGKDIKKVACSVETKERGGGLYGEEGDVPLSHNFGEFRFIAPNKLLYHIRGEFQYDKEEDGKKKPEYKKGLGEKKFVLDGKSLTEYDFKNRVALVTPIPEDQQNKDLTMDGPIPIFFIAKADNLKRRFYMKLITKPEKQDKEVWIEAWPRQAADAQSFQRIIITLRLSDLQPYYMRQYHANGKSYSELWFYDISINKGMWTIEPKIDFGWKREEAETSKVSLGNGESVK